MPKDPRDLVVEVLSRSALLGALPREALERLADRSVQRNFEANQYVFRRGDDGGVLFVLLSGRIKIVAPAANGAEVILNVIEPEEVFGEISLIDGADRCADAVASSPATAVAIDQRDFMPILAESPEAAHEMMVILCGRIRQTSTFVESAVLMPAQARIFVRLRGLAEQFGVRRPDGSIHIEHGFSQQELGEIVGLTRVSVNKHLADWRRAELIDYRQGELHILDLAALEKRVLAEVEEREDLA